jgi:hypothetical protein
MTTIIPGDDMVKAYSCVKINQTPSQLCFRNKLSTTPLLNREQSIRLINRMVQQGNSDCVELTNT